MSVCAVRLAFVWTAVLLVAVLILSSGAAAVQVGDQAPDFQLPATTGGEISGSATFAANRWCCWSSIMPIGAPPELPIWPPGGTTINSF